MNDLKTDAIGDFQFSTNPLVCFLYLLLRDHLPAGTVENLVKSCDHTKIRYTNGYLAQYAENIANKLK